MLHIWRELSGAGCNTKGPISFIEPEDKAILCEICHSPETQPSTKPWTPAGRWWPKTGLHHTGDSTQPVLLAPTRIFLCYMQFLFFVIAKSTINQPARKLNWSDWQLSSLQPRLRAKTKQSKISAPKAQNKENKQGKQNKENKQDNPPPPLAKCAPPMLLSAGPKQSGPSHSKLSGAPRLLWTGHEKQKTTRG